MATAKLICGDFVRESLVRQSETAVPLTYDAVFMDPPDNIGLNYDGDDDCMEAGRYLSWLRCVLRRASWHSDKIWISFNSRHIVQMGVIVDEFCTVNGGWACTPCVQTFTFGNYQKTRLTDCYRPLWCVHREHAQFYPGAVRVQSERQKTGDKRADPNGRVPSNIFDFPRVTGNSRQRRKWHPTQLHEGLVERVLKYSVPPGGSVLDPFAGTGTVLRVAGRLGINSVSVERSRKYCEHIARENGLESTDNNTWELSQ